MRFAASQAAFVQQALQVLVQLKGATLDGSIVAGAVVSGAVAPFTGPAEVKPQTRAQLPEWRTACKEHAAGAASLPVAVCRLLMCSCDGGMPQLGLVLQSAPLRHGQGKHWPHACMLTLGPFLKKCPAAVHHGMWHIQ